MNADLIAKPIELIGFNIGALASARPDEFRAIEAELVALVDAGAVSPAAPHQRPLVEGPAALAELAARATTGKTVLIP